MKRSSVKKKQVLNFSKNLGLVYDLSAKKLDFFSFNYLLLKLINSVD